MRVSSRRAGVARAARSTRAFRSIRGAPLAGVLVAVVVFLAPGCSNRGDDGFAARAVAELRASGFAGHLGVQQPSRTLQRGDWTEFYFDAAAEQAICLGGSDFQGNVRHGTSGRVLLYLQGGGACWDHDSCWVQHRALEVANSAIQSGALAVADPASPFHDDDVVYVPYCDGSLYGGDTTVDYGGVRTFHHGLWNLSVAVDLLAREFPDPSQIVVAGSSAGGYGTVPGYAVTRIAFPDVPVVVFSDSGPAIENHDVPASIARAGGWRAADRYPASCARCAEHGVYLLDWALARDPALRVAQFGYQADAIIMDFFEWDADTYRDLLLTVSADIRDRHPGRFERYYVAGDGHTILQFPQFHALSVDGVRVADWTRAFLDGSDAWRDVVESPR